METTWKLNIGNRHDVFVSKLLELLEQQIFMDGPQQNQCSGILLEENIEGLSTTLSILVSMDMDTLLELSYSIVAADLPV